MAKVKNLTLKQQTSSDGLIATWGFDVPKHVSTTTSSGTIRVGDWVKVKSGSEWYNGAGIASFVFNDEWQVIEVRGDRAVIDKNRSGSNSICSPINVNNLTGGSGGATTSTTTTDTLDHYTYEWFYTTGEKRSGGSAIFYSQGAKDTTDTYTTYDPPEEAIAVHCHVTPVAKKYDVNGGKASYWTGEMSNVVFYTTDMRPNTPSTPTVSISGYMLTAQLDNIEDEHTDRITYQVYNGTSLFTSGTVDVLTARATFTCTVQAGGSYRVRAQAVNVTAADKITSDWSGYSDDAETQPSAPAGITTVRGASSSSIYVEWSPVTTATSYEVEYATALDYFGGSNSTNTQTGIEDNHFLFTGLDSGYEYFFRVRAANAQGNSAWTDIASCTIGKKPSAPTTWSSTTTAVVGEKLYLYYVHNAQDNSLMQVAEVGISTDGGATYVTSTIKASGDEETDSSTQVYTVDTSKYSEGTEIYWRVRTCGATMEYGPYSTVRVVKVYAQPTLSLSVTDKDGKAVSTLTSFPLNVKGVAGPSTQAPVSYYLSIYPMAGYEAINAMGDSQRVSAGELVYSKTFDAVAGSPFTKQLTPADIDLESGIEYALTLLVSMDSGLTAQAEATFDVSWADMVYDIDAAISVDTASWTAYVTPYLAAIDSTDTEVAATLAVYRRDYDGSKTLIQGDIEPNMNTAITDPHPALDYARYRIVATDSNTGAISFYDVPNYPVGGKAYVIQWDEDWSEFSGDNADTLAQQPWSGSMVQFPYNQEEFYSTSVEKNLVEYQGRSYPVAYYGTMIDESVSWKCDLVRDDTDTIYQLRRLQKYHGNCYVRDPSGFGCWASVDVSFERSYDSGKQPVTINITRVEGGA